MLLKELTPKELAIDLLDRSICSVQVAAVLADNHGIFSWGINHTGFDGYGMHAEQYCILRANKKRLRKATLYVCARRKKNNNIVLAKPCIECQGFIQEVSRVQYRDKNGMWRILR